MYKIYINVNYLSLSIFFWNMLYIYNNEHPSKHWERTRKKGIFYWKLFLCQLVSGNFKIEKMQKMCLMPGKEGRIIWNFIFLLFLPFLKDPALLYNEEQYIPFQNNNVSRCLQSHYAATRSLKKLMVFLWRVMDHVHGVPLPPHYTLQSAN